MKDLNLNHWLMLTSETRSEKGIGLGFMYLAGIFFCAYVAVSLIN